MFLAQLSKRVHLLTEPVPSASRHLGTWWMSNGSNRGIDEMCLDAHSKPARAAKKTSLLADMVFRGFASIASVSLQSISKEGELMIEEEQQESHDNTCEAYQSVSTAFYDLDKPVPPQDALDFYTQHASQARGPILEPMCGSGRFLIPMLQRGFPVKGFDTSQAMLNSLRASCEKNNVACEAALASFENYAFASDFRLVFIPSGSFCLLTEEEAIDHALHSISSALDQGGKFVFEVDTLALVPGIRTEWTGTWVNCPDGGKIVLSSMGKYDASKQLQMSLNRYELWQGNKIQETEVEEFTVRLYEKDELDTRLKKHGFQVKSKQVPYRPVPASDTTEVIVYECEKS